MQDYTIAGKPSRREDLLNTMVTAIIRFDDGPVADSGQDFVPVDSVVLVFRDRELPDLPPGLSFSSVVDPVVVHNFNAVYVDGVYSKFGWRDDGGALFRARFSPEGPGINLISFTLSTGRGGGQLSLQTSNAPRYNMSAVGEPDIAVEPHFLRGDCNDDVRVDVSDAVCILDALFLGLGGDPSCLAAVNANGDVRVDISDPIFLLDYLFLGGPAPVDPFPNCGPPTLEADAALGCEGSSCA